MNLGCYETEEEEIFLQEGIDYFQKNKFFLDEYAEKIKLINENGVIKRIPLITHQVYLTNIIKPKELDAISIRKTVQSLELLNNLEKDFKHYIWVSKTEIIPQEITIIKGVELHYIEELNSTLIGEKLTQILAEEYLDSSAFAKASDLIRYAALFLYGGMYRDLDYEIYKPKEFLKLLSHFDFVGGKEFDDHEPVYIGSALIASIPGHPILYKAMELLVRNLSEDLDILPEYLKYPCDKINQQIYQTGPAVITTAFYLSANQEGYNDLLLPPNILYNWEYAKATTPDSKCHVKGKIVEQNPNTIGADMFCGGWHKNNTRFYYSKNVNIYLYFAAQDGDLQMAIRSINDGADVNKIFSPTQVTPLYIAAQNGHIEIVKLLVEKGADLDITQPNGATALYAAVVQKHTLIAKILIMSGSSLSINNDKGERLLQKTIDLGDSELINLIKDKVIYLKSKPKAINIDCYSILNEEVYFQENIDFVTQNSTLTLDFFEKSTNIDRYSTIQKNRIPNISHQIYLTTLNAPKPLSSLQLKKIITNIERLKEVNKDWKFNFWTNNADSIPLTIKNITNVELRLIEELRDETLYRFAEELVNSADIPSFTGASDLIRYTVLKKFGGVYYDLDYEFYNTKKLLELMNSFNLLAGKEFDQEYAQIGNSLISSIPEHTIINQTIDWIKRNFDSNQVLPDYLKFACTNYNKVMFRNGPSVFSLAVYKGANLNGNIDFIAMSSKVFFNIDYAHATTLDSPCSKPGQPATLINKVGSLEIETIGADMLCGGWTPPEYFNPIFYSEKISSYLYIAAQDGDYESVTSYIAYGADVNKIFSPTQVTPLYISVQNGHVEVAKKLIGAGASIWAKSPKGDSIIKAAYLSKNIEMIELIKNEHKKALDSTELGCFQGDIEDVFIQENFNYIEENKKLVDDARKNYSNIKKYISLNKNPIELITQQIYFSFNSKPIDKMLIEKTKTTLERLNEQDLEWKHIFWTNNLSIIPEEIKEIRGVEVHLIDELQDSDYFPLLKSSLKRAEQDKTYLTQASDIARLLILYEQGGVYRDFDNEIYRAQDLIDMLKAYNFVGGKERHSEVSYIGNAFLAANMKHPIIEAALKEFIKRNFNETHEFLPLYLKYPCNHSVKVIYETGSPVITLAYFKAANQNGNVDIVMPGNVFYNVEYAWSTTPLSKCYKPNNEVQLDNIIDGELVKTIGSDLFCGSWHSLKLIEYPENKDIYLYLAAQNGELADVERLLNEGANPNSLRVNSASPLAVAVQNGHLEIVKLLVENGGKVNFSGDGFTPLYRAIQEENYEITEYLISKGADTEIIQANGLSMLFYAVYKNLPKIVKILLQSGAKTDFIFRGETAEEYAIRNKLDLIEKEFLIQKFFTSVLEMKIDEVAKYLQMGVEINSTHNFNATALYYATRNEDIELVKFLLQKGADVNLSIIGGDTPLYMAASKGSLEIVKILVAAGADLEAKVDGVNTALFIATHFQHKEVVQYLLECGANILNVGQYPIMSVQEFNKQKSKEDAEINRMIVAKYLETLPNTLKEFNYTNNRSFEVVVARYEEDISWLLKEFPNEKITIYNKGASEIADLPDNIKVIRLPNVGRESHTYLTHIINNYDNLTDRTLFIQGYPYEHPLSLPLASYKNLTQARCRNIIALCHDVRSIEDMEKDLNTQISVNYPYLKNSQSFTQFVRDFIDENINKDYLLPTVNGAQFALDKEIILRNNKDFYKKLLIPLAITHPLEGYYFERTWDLIFKQNVIDANINDIMFHASWNGDLETVKNSIRLGADINSQHTSNATALYAAAKRNHLDIVLYLLGKGADLELAINGGATPLHAAVLNGNTKIVELLLEAGANPEAKFGNHVVLNGAIQNKRVEEVKLLLKHGARIIIDEYYTPMMSAGYNKNVSPENEEIFQIIMEHYWSIVEEYHKNNSIKSNKNFEVVVVRYKEDLSWLNKEFPNEKIVIYNKGPDDLINLPHNAEVRKIENLGFLGGTYLYHIVNYYDTLADRTLFLQGFPYDQEVFLPLIRHKTEIVNNCNNIIAKCQDTTIFEQANELNAYTEDEWRNSKYSGFKPIAYDITYFAHNFINPNLNVNATLKMALGAQMAVDKEKILNHSKNYYQKIFAEFNTTFPRQDFFLEKLWDEVFELEDKNLSIKLKETNTYMRNYYYNEFTKADNLDQMSLILDNLVEDINSFKNERMMVIASYKNKINVVKILLSLGVSPNSKNDNGITSLHAAVTKNNKEIVKLLLDNKADVNQRSEDKLALSTAILNGNLELAQILLDAGSELGLDEYDSAVMAADIVKNKSPTHQEIYQIIKGKYNYSLPSLQKEYESFKDKEVEVVISRYNEDISWAFEEFPWQKVYLYNKGDDNLPALPKNFEVNKLDNVGRESHTYLHHILTHYDNLPDRILFVQGSPYDHEVYLPLMKSLYSNQTKCNNIIAKCFSAPLKLMQLQFDLTNWSDSKWNDIVLNNQTLYDFSKIYTGIKYSEDAQVNMVFGAQFALDKEKILCQHPSYYQKLYNALMIKHPLEVHHIERTWDLFFQCKKTLGIEKKGIDKIPPIFIINLPSSENRREKIKEQLDKFALNYSFFEATDGYKIKITDLATGDSFTGLDIKNNKNKFGYQSTYKITCDPSDVNPFEFKYSEILKDWNDPITAGELGIWCSYLRLYKKINDEKIEDAIIFEDDIIIKSENFDNELFNFIKHVPKDYDMAFLDLNLYKGQQFQLTDNPYINKFSPDARAWGMYAALCSNKMTNKLLSIETYSQRIDNYIWDLANQQNNIDFYVSSFDSVGVEINGSIICEMGRGYLGC